MIKSIAQITFPLISLFFLTQLKNKEPNWNLPLKKKPVKLVKELMIKDSTISILKFSNYTWHIKSGAASPGPNIWNANNAYVDSTGSLHLKITYDSLTKKWNCAEIWTTESLGFGTYEWFVDGPIDKLDKNIVLGLFNYPSLTNTPDATNEIDIEYAKWGIEKNKPGNFTVWPSILLNNYTNKTYPFNISLLNNRTIQRFNWQPFSVFFECLYEDTKDNYSLISSKIFETKKTKMYIPQTAEPVHINLWLFKGLPPSNNLPVEIIISSFQKR